MFRRRRHSSPNYHAGIWNGTAASFIDLHPASAFTSEIYSTDGTHQGGNAVFAPSQSRAALWSGTAASFVNLHPAGATASNINGVWGGRQVGTAFFGGATHASLWTGTAASWVDLSPAGSASSLAFKVYDNQQVGYANFGSPPVQHAGLWTGTAPSWVDLNPVAGMTSQAIGVYGGIQVGYAGFGGASRASLWRGTPASWVNLSVYLPPGYSVSVGQSVWTDGSTIRVAGYAYLPSAGNRTDAILWTYTPPLHGDINCDGVVDVGDANALALALIDPAAFAASYPGCDISQADVNLDSMIDGQDTSAWVHLLL